MLEQAGIVERAFYARHPPRADDRLTEKGEKMRGILGAMRRWGLDHG
jgi:DNA-binding HxlR family transcriptional regulator